MLNIGALEPLNDLSLDIELQDWLTRWKLTRYADLLLEHEVIDLESARQLTEVDLKEMGIMKVGARRRFLMAIGHERRRSYSEVDTESVAPLVEADLAHMEFGSNAHRLSVEGCRKAYSSGTLASVSEISLGPSVHGSVYTARDSERSLMEPSVPKAKDAFTQEKRPGSAVRPPSALVRPTSAASVIQSSADWVRGSRPTSSMKREGQLPRKPPHRLDPMSSFREEWTRSGQGDDDPGDELTDMVVNVGQALGIMKPGLQDPQSPIVIRNKEDQQAFSQQYLEAQQKFMDFAKTRATTQEHFLAEAEEMKGLNDQDLVGTLRKFICNSPLLANRTENLMGRKPPGRGTNVVPAQDDLWNGLGADSKARSRPTRLRSGRKGGRTQASAFTPPINSGKQNWKQMLQEQEEMNQSLQVHDEHYKRLIERFVESEKTAFGRLMGREEADSLECLNSPTASMRLTHTSSRFRL